jgi:hypothetical protein
MSRIVDVDRVQKQLDRAARDAKHGPAEVRAGRFVHRNSRVERLTISKQERTLTPDKRRTRKEKQA